MQAPPRLYGDSKLRSGDHINVPVEDANDGATQVVRAALRSQSPRLHLTPPDHVVVLNIASLTDADERGRLTVTLLSGATIHSRADDVRPDPQLAFLRTVLTEAISKEAASRAAPPTIPLPQEYPDESMVMTVVFYYNEQPPKSS